MYSRTVSIGGIAAASANNIALSQTPSAAGNLTLNGSTVSNGVATLDVARRVLLTFGADTSARTFVIYGTNIFGNSIQETLLGSATTSQSLQDYLTVTRISIDGASPGTITAGTSSVASTPWMSVSTYVSPVSINFDCIATGTVNYSIEYTVWNVNQIGIIPWIIPNAVAVTNLSAKTSSAQGNNGNVTINAWRITLNSGSGSVQATAGESGPTQ